MQTILWFAGVLAVWTGLKFVFMVFKRLGSKSTINDLLDRAEDSMADAADTVAKSVKNRKTAKKRKKNEDEWIVTIH